MTLTEIWAFFRQKLSSQLD